MFFGQNKERRSFFVKTVVNKGFISDANDTYGSFQTLKGSCLNIPNGLDYLNFFRTRLLLMSEGMFTAGMIWPRIK